MEAGCYIVNTSSEDDQTHGLAMHVSNPTPASTEEKVRVLLVDDHPAIRAGIRTFLDADPRLHVVAEAKNGEEAMSYARSLLPDVILLDMEMPALNGVEVCRLIKSERLPSRVLGYSSHADATYVRGVLKNGAHGYVTKDVAGLLVVEAILAVSQGEERWFVPPHKGVDPSADEEVGLTKRESDVLKLLARGRSNSQIGSLLKLSEHSVKNLLTKVYQKIGVSGAREAVAWAWENGVVKSSAKR